LVIDSLICFLDWFRKNPTHFAGFCHPGDESYDEALDEAEEKLTTKKKLREKGRMA
jgi:hypothetical protein